MSIAVIDGVSHFGADEHHVQLPAQVEVADVLGSAEQKLGVFRAQHTGAKNRTSHSRTLPGNVSYRLMEITAGEVVLGSTGVSAADVVAVASRGAKVGSPNPPARPSPAARRSSRHLAERDDAVYGISTGFGSLATTVIPPERREELQRALIRSHARRHGPARRAGSRAGDDAAAGAHAGDGVLAACARSSSTRSWPCSTPTSSPPVHEHGSLGASGDLAPLAHVALALIGEGECADRRWRPPASPRSTLRAKEGLALINGTDGMLGMLVLALADLDVLVRTADIAAAMSVEALMATDRAFAADLMALRPHHGQTMSAANLRRLLEASPIVASHRTNDPRVQDAYSLRCAPQVHGAARDTITFARGCGRHRA